MVCFLGFQSQTSAQADLLLTTSALSPAETAENLKEIATDFDFANANSEAIGQRLRDFGAVVLAVTENDPIREVEQEFTRNFMETISRNLETNPNDVLDAVSRAYQSSISSQLVIRHQNIGVNFQALAEDVLRAID